MAIVEWPSTLVDRITFGHWVLFIGSGVSASCRNASGDSPPTWSGLLERLANLIADPAKKKTAKSLIKAKDYLAAADHIRFTIAQEQNIAAYHQTLKRSVEGPPGDRFRPSTFFDRLLDLEPRIVFTTNYDKLFETASRNEYRTYTPFEVADASDALRLGEPVLVKLHGSTNAMDEAVLTRTDFARVMTAGRRTLDLLSALSLTATFLFVGYSLDDPDVQLVLQAVGRSAFRPEAHFLLAPRPASAARVPVFRESYGVSVLTYPPRSHEKAEEAIAELVTLVLNRRESGVPTI
jgi:hypothetical protein